MHMNPNSVTSLANSALGTLDERLGLMATGRAFGTNEMIFHPARLQQCGVLKLDASFSSTTAMATLR